MMNELILVTGPASEPVSLAEAKAHLRVDVADDDLLIGGLISAAREAFEEINGRSLLPTTWSLVLDGWPAQDWITLPRPPLVSVTGVSYIDSAGVTQTFAPGSYVVTATSTPGKVYLGNGASWPSATLGSGLPIAITYTAGWASAAAVPQRYKQAILLLLAHWYENREMTATGTTVAKYPMAFESLATLDRVWL